MKKFNQWMEIKENLDPPAHEMGEENMEVPSIIRIRLEMLMDELEKKRNLPKEQQVIILQKVIASMQNSSTPLNQQELQKTARGQTPQQNTQQPPPPQNPQQIPPSNPMQ